MATDQTWRVDRTQLRNQLEARRSELMGDLQRLRARIRDHGSEPTRPRAEDEADEDDLDANLIDIVNTTLRRIDVALDRVRRGSYGQCTRCHGAIGESRLVAMPFAVRCHRCESARERGSQSPRSGFRMRLWAESTT